MAKRVITDEQLRAVSAASAEVALFTLMRILEMLRMAQQPQHMVAILFRRDVQDRVSALITESVASVLTDGAEETPEQTDARLNALLAAVLEVMPAMPDLPPIAARGLVS